MRRSSMATVFIMMSTVLVSAEDDADEDRTSRQKVRSSWRYSNYDERSQWAIFCEEFPYDAICRHESDPAEINVLARTMPMAPSEPDTPVEKPSQMPSITPLSQLPTSSLKEEPSGQPSREMSDSPSLLISSFPSILPTMELSQPPSIVESMPPSEADLTQTPSRHPSPIPSMAPSQVLKRTSKPTSAPSESTITAPPIGYYTSFPSQYPSGSPSDSPNGTTLMPSSLSAPPKGNYTFFPSQSPSDALSYTPSVSIVLPSLPPSTKPGLCTPDPNGDYGLKTNTSLLIVYYYEVEYNPSVFDPIPNDVIFRIERKISEALIPVLFSSECASARGREILKNTERQRFLQSSNGIVGLSRLPIDMPIPVTCTKELSVPTNACTLVEGQITLFLTEGSEPNDDQGNVAIDEIEASIDSGELVASEPGMLQSVFIRGAIVETDAPTQSPANGATNLPASNPDNGPQQPTIASTDKPTDVVEVSRGKKIPVFIFAILIGIIPLVVLAIFFLCSQRKRRRESNSVLEDSTGTGARGRRRLHLMSIPGRDSEHSLSLPLASCSNSRSDSGSFRSLIAQPTPVPEGDEELKLRPNATGTLM